MFDHIIDEVFQKDIYVWTKPTVLRTLQISKIQHVENKLTMRKYKYNSNYKPYFPTVNTDCLFKSDKNVDITNNALFYKRIYIW